MSIDLNPLQPISKTSQLQRRLLSVFTACSMIGLAACSTSDEASVVTSTSASNETGSASADSSSTTSASSSETLGANSDFLAAAEENSIPVLEPTVVAVHPWNTSSFTQGLEYDATNQELLVGTGRTGESRIYRTSIDGVESTSQDLDADFFGEGVALTSQKVWQLTWRDGVAISRDPQTLEEIERVDLAGEGWGLCTLPADANNPERLVLSDGTDTLRILDADSFEELDSVQVHLGDHPVEYLNELECVLQSETDEDLGSEVVVYANIFLNTAIVRIDFDQEDPATFGQVSAVIDGSLLENNAEDDHNNVLNGIAHLPGTQDYLLTGKYWPDLYQVQFQ